METIPVKPHPFRQSFESVEAAIAHSMSHPDRPAVEADARLIEDTTLVGAYWSLSEVALHFSNDRWLHLFIADAAVTWRLSDDAPRLNCEQPFRIGAEPVLLDWQASIGSDRWMCQA